MVWVFKWKWLNHTFNSTRHCSPTRYCNGSLDHLNERSNGTGAKLATTFMWFWGFVCLTFPRQTFSAFCKIFHGVYFNHVHLPPALLFRVSALELQVVLYLFAAPMCQWRSLRVVSCESSGNDSDRSQLHLSTALGEASWQGLISYLQLLMRRIYFTSAIIVVPCWIRPWNGALWKFIKVYQQEVKDKTIEDSRHL